MFCFEDLVEILFEVFFNTKSASKCAISDSLQKFGKEIGSELFLSSAQTMDDNRSSNIGFYSTKLRVDEIVDYTYSYKSLESYKVKTKPKCDLENCISDYGKYYRFKH